MVQEHFRFFRKHQVQVDGTSGSSGTSGSRFFRN
jgi:hypothetical protein